MEVTVEQCSKSVSTHRGVTADALDKINLPEINLSIWERKQTSLELAAKELIESSFVGDEFIYKRGDSIELIGSYFDNAAQLKSNNAEALKADILLLMEKMLQLCDDQEFSISLDHVKNNKCPSFHTDFISLRLICTYWGEGSHWLNNNNVKREGLGKNNNDLVVKDWSQVNKMKAGWVGVFKGGRYPGNKNSGVVHRSPEILGDEGATRLMLRIDTIKSFGKKGVE